jgi:hypothetical protein
MHGLCVLQRVHTCFKTGISKICCLFRKEFNTVSNSKLNEERDL